MKRDTDLGWGLIEHDPVLRLELSSIEKHPADDNLVAELIEFFARTEGIIKLAGAIVEEDLEIVRQEDWETIRL